MMQAWQYRDGDIVEVTPERRGGTTPVPFEAVVDTRRIPPQRSSFTRATTWVWVRRPKRDHFSGGWYPSQVRLIRRPKPKRTLKIPPNIILGDE
jgi:hypothetical protein